MLIALLVVLAQAHASPDRWVRLYSDNISTTFGDSLTMEILGDRRRAWLRIEHTSPQDGAWTSDVQIEADCTGRTLRTLAYAARDRAGNSLRGGNFRFPENSPVIPETHGERLYNLLCGAEGFRPPG